MTKYLDEFGWSVLIGTAIAVLSVVLFPNRSPDKIKLELHLNGSKTLMAIDRDKIVRIDLYPESGTYKITYIPDAIEETL